MRGLLPETRVRTPVTLLVMLLTSEVFLVFRYWTEHNRSVTFQERIAFLEETITKATHGEAEAIEREKDLQRALKRHRDEEVDTKALLHSEFTKMNNKFELEKNHLLQNLHSKDAIIREKQELLDGVKKDFQVLQLEVESFQRNQSKLLQEFTLQSETLKTALRLKEQCDAQMKSIARAGYKPPRRNESVTARQRRRREVKRNQSEDNIETSKRKATPEPIPAIKLSASSSPSKTLLQLSKLGNEHRNISSHSVAAKASDIAVQTERRTVPAPAVEKESNTVNAPSAEEDEEPVDDKVPTSVHQNTPTHQPEDKQNVLANKKDDEEDKETMEPF